MNWIEKTIVPKSDQLNAEDLLTGPITVTIKGVRQGSADQPAIVDIDGGRQPYKPCKTMRRVLVACWGTDTDAWIGRQMTLFCDPDVKWAGDAVGGIRISHLSHIDGEKMLKLSESKGKRKPVRIQPLKTSKPAKFTHPILDKHREALTGAPKPVLNLAKSISEGLEKRDAEILTSVEAQLDGIGDEWRPKLSALLRDVLAEVST